MFEVNLLNKPGRQNKDTINKSIVFNQTKIISNNSEIASNSPDKNKFKGQAKKLDLLTVMIIILILGIIISTLLGYYLKYL